MTKFLPADRYWEVAANVLLAAEPFRPEGFMNLNSLPSALAEAKLAWPITGPPACDTAGV